MNRLSFQCKFNDSQSECEDSQQLRELLSPVLNGPSYEFSVEFLDYLSAAKIPGFEYRVPHIAEGNDYTLNSKLYQYRKNLTLGIQTSLLSSNKK